MNTEYNSAADSKISRSNSGGKKGKTRVQRILRQLNLKIHGAKLRHRYSRQVLLKLKDHGEWKRKLKVLEDDGVRALTEKEGLLRRHERVVVDLLRDARVPPARDICRRSAGPVVRRRIRAHERACHNIKHQS